MDVRLLIVAGASLAFVIAFIIFVVTVTAASRTARAQRRQRGSESLPDMARGHGTLDTNLAGLDVRVADDAISASLLTPLRDSQWIPPVEPAPIQELVEASLDGRIVDFRPAPGIEEPPFSVPERPRWSVDAGISQAENTLAHEAHEPESAELDDDFDAEIAALLPQSPTLAPAPAYEMPNPEPAHEAPESEPAHEAPAPELVYETPMPQPVYEIPTPEPVTWSMPDPSPEAIPVPGTESHDTTDADEDAEAVLWRELLAEQNREGPRAVVARHHKERRPEVRVTTSDPEVAVAVPEPRPESVARVVSTRPRVRVRVHSRDEATQQAVRSPVAGVELVMSPHSTGRDAVDPHLSMAAPIEMWFGDSRVGVKPGTATFDRFRKYADVLLADVKGTRLPIL